MLPSVMEYRQRSRKRLPRLAFDYLDGGAEQGITMARNLAAYGKVEFRPEVMANVAQCNLGTQVLGADLAMPAVVGTTGLNGLFWPAAGLTQACAAPEREGVGSGQRVSGRVDIGGSLVT